jgi:hypothetical protein
MGFPTTAVGLSIFRDYYQACVDMRFRYSDQAKLSALLHRTYGGAWEFVSSAAFGRRAAPRYDATFVHFTAARDAILTTYYWLQLRKVPLPRRLWLHAWGAMQPSLYRLRMRLMPMPSKAAAPIESGRLVGRGRSG